MEGEQETATAPEAATQTAEQVAEAATSATEAAAQTGNDGWKVVADELKGLRGDIKELLASSKQEPAKQEEPKEETPASPPAAPATPDVSINVPAPERKKYRHGMGRRK